MIEGLPADFPGAVLIVVHTPPLGRSRLPGLLQRATPLPVALASHGELLRPGHIYIAPPDRHLIARYGHLDLSHGPRENHTRPAIDPLFRSAARAYGDRAIGVILSGTLYDGTSGLMAINAHGGVAIVQDPAEAVVAGMPESALRHARADHILPAAGIAAVLSDLVGRTTRPGHRTDPRQETPVMTDDAERLDQAIERDFSRQGQDQRTGESTMYVCPDCGGVLWQSGTGPDLAFRCHVGHAFSPESLAVLQSEDVEAAIWTCVRLLREKATLSRQLATRAREGGQVGAAADRFDEQAERDDHYVTVLRTLLEQANGPAELVAGTDIA